MASLSTHKLNRMRRRILATELSPGYLVASGKLYIAERPDDIEALQALSKLVVEANDIPFAARCFELLLEAGVTDEDVYVGQLEALMWLGNIEEGRRVCREAANIIQSPDGLGTLHRVATGLGEFDCAIFASQRLLDMDQHDTVRWSRHGTALQHKGDLEGAEAAYRRSLALNPDRPLTRFLLSACRRWTPDDNNLDDIRSAMERENEGTAGWIQLVYSLAKELEDLGRYDEAFEHYAKGARNVREGIDYTTDTDKRKCELLLKLYELPGTPGVESNKKPIFILGMPRTGSTLTERIVSSHSRIVSQGETHALLSSLRQALGAPQANTAVFQQLLKEAKAVDYTSIGQRYIEYVEPRDEDCDYFVEKMPENVFLAGLILKALTNAKIIYTDRNPMDTCFSNFKQLFNRGYFPYSYDLVETATHYKQVKSFANHWCARNPNHVMMVNYDRLVAAPEEEIDRLLAFIGVDSEPSCYLPEKNTSGLSTASFSQARQPIYKSSSEKWRKYERHLSFLESHFSE